MRKLLLLLLLTLTSAACGGSDRVATPPRVTSFGPVYRAAAPAGESGTFVAVYFSLADAEDSPANLTVEISRDNGAFAAVGAPTTGETAAGGDGVRGLTALREGSSHRFVWKVPADLGSGETVIMRLTPFEEEVIEGRQSVGAQIGKAVTGPAFTLGGLVQEPQ